MSAAGPVTTEADGPATSEAAGPATTEIRYVGLVTRTIAFTLDAIIITVVALTVDIGVGLAVSVLHLPSPVKKALVAVAAGVFVLWTIGYFVGFWSTTGQTPGNRVMQFKILTTKGEVQKPRRALLRCGGVVLAALPLFAGILWIAFDGRRRGLQDLLARTVAVEAPDVSIAARRQAVLRAAAATRSPDSDDDRTVGVADPGGQREPLTPDSAPPFGPLGHKHQRL